MKALLLLPTLLVGLNAATIVVDSSTITGSYNPLNKLPSVAPGSSSTVAQFTSAVSTAFAAGNGAVWGFNHTVNPGPYISTSVSDTWALTFAPGKTLSVGQSVLMRYNNFGSAGATSSGTADMFSGVNGDSSFTLTFSLSGANLGTDEKILQIGFAVLSRTSGTTPTYTITATQDDNSTIVLTDTVTAGGAVDADNTHFGIVATAGRYIKGVTISATNSQAAIIDDFGFITGTPSAVPEPATFATLAGAFILGSAAYRRRRS